MSGLDKIINHIEASATESADKLIAEAKAEAESITSIGKKEADARAAAIRKQSESDVQAAVQRNHSAAEMTEKRLVLQAKQDTIDSILAEAVEKLKGLSDSEYFDIIIRMIPKYAQDKEGVIRFSGKDLGRLPAGFESKISGALSGDASLIIGEEPAKIDGGFVLEYGDIEENCSFDALVDASKENLQDKIGAILFG